MRSSLFTRNLVLLLGARVFYALAPNVMRTIIYYVHAHALIALNEKEKPTALNSQFRWLHDRDRDRNGAQQFAHTNARASACECLYWRFGVFIKCAAAAIWAPRLLIQTDSIMRCQSRTWHAETMPRNASANNGRISDDNTAKFGPAMCQRVRASDGDIIKTVSFDKFLNYSQARARHRTCTGRRGMEAPATENATLSQGNGFATCVAILPQNQIKFKLFTSVRRKLLSARGFFAADRGARESGVRARASTRMIRELFARTDAQLNLHFYIGCCSRGCRGCRGGRVVIFTGRACVMVASVP